MHGRVEKETTDNHTAPWTVACRFAHCDATCLSCLPCLCRPAAVVRVKAPCLAGRLMAASRAATLLAASISANLAAAGTAEARVDRTVRLVTLPPPMEVTVLASSSTPRGASSEKGVASSPTRDTSDS